MGDTFLICSSFVLKSIVDCRDWVAAWLVHSLIQQYLLFPSSLMIHYKWITGKDLLHSTGNSAQYYEATHPNGKRLREIIHTGTWITKSLCCTPETNKTLFMNYAPVYKIKGFKKSMKTKKLQTAVICVLMLLCVPLFVTPWIIAHQAPLSMGFSRQEYWSGLPFPPPGHLPDPGVEPTSHMSPALAGGFFTTTTPGESPGGVHCAIYFWLAPSSGQRETSGPFGHQGSLESWVTFEGTSNKWQMSQMCQVWEKLLFCIVVDFFFQPYYLWLWFYRLCLYNGKASDKILKRKSFMAFLQRILLIFLKEEPYSATWNVVAVFSGVLLKFRIRFTWNSLSIYLY